MLNQKPIKKKKTCKCLSVLQEKTKDLIERDPLEMLNTPEDDHEYTINLQ